MENINSEIDCHAINIYEIAPPIHAINVKVVCKREREREMELETNTVIHHNRCVSNLILSGLNTANMVNNRVYLRGGLIYTFVNLDSTSDLKFRLIVGGFLLGILVVILFVITNYK